MEFKRNSVIALYLAGKSQPEIVKMLKYLNVNKMFVYRTITRYNDTGSIAKRHGGGPTRTATSQDMIRKVKAKILRSPHCSANKMAGDMNISRSSMGRILKDHLGLKALKFQKARVLTPGTPATGPSKAPTKEVPTKNTLKKKTQKKKK